MYNNIYNKKKQARFLFFFKKNGFERNFAQNTLSRKPPAANRRCRSCTVCAPPDSIPLP